MHFRIFLHELFQKKVTKERLELKTSYLIRQVLTKWSSKTYCNVQKGIGGGGGGVVVVDGLGEHAQKKHYFHTRKKFRFSMTTRVRSRLVYPKDAHFPICF
jgi:hypothetical protein